MGNLYVLCNVFVMLFRHLAENDFFIELDLVLLTSKLNPYFSVFLNPS